jgi:hypothetical protein
MKLSQGQGAAVRVTSLGYKNFPAFPVANVQEILQLLQLFGYFNCLKSSGNSYVPAALIDTPHVVFEGFFMILSINRSNSGC